ncbi:spore gernimation protein GerPD [Ectobacillus ponti]|uniref:Spore gernimation protein GerPD n=1 Tax=Ectobacillus ponti TaxID=2961894 RepID=A0AA42BQA3_9BACI|nr:spore gernimation protein GerPD [Ectobacillus ponti]MCP8968244.1 spore gernimation protein GerPD [Ectobacillus ponti]
MNYTVVNHEIKIGSIRAIGVSAAALFIVGDANFLVMSSILDTPPESIGTGPFVPIVFDLPATPG